MRKLSVLFAIVLLISATWSGAQIASYSGGTINIGVVPAATATAFTDTMTAVHSKLETRTKALPDTLTAIHAKLETRTKALPDTLTAIHSKLETRTKTLSDSVTAAHTSLSAFRKATGDTLIGAHINLSAFRKATGDTLTNVHTQLLVKVLAATDTTKNTHTQLLAKILLNATGITAATDTITAAHTQLLAKILAATDTTKNTHTQLLAKILLNATNVFYEQADVPITFTAIADSGTTVLNLRTASTRYVLRNMRIKSADPGANTATVTLWGFVNDVFLAVDTFAITTSNFTNYFSLQDMFGEPQVYGDNLMIMIQMDAGTAAITGQYSFAKTNN